MSLIGILLSRFLILLSLGAVGWGIGLAVKGAQFAAFTSGPGLITAGIFLLVLTMIYRQVDYLAESRKRADGYVHVVSPELLKANKFTAIGIGVIVLVLLVIFAA